MSDQARFQNDWKTDIAANQETALEEALSQLAEAHDRQSCISLQDRIRLCEQCLAGVIHAAPEWAESGARGKGCPGERGVLAEEMLGGPVVVARQLWLTIQTLQALNSERSPMLPAQAAVNPDGITEVPVFPTRGVFDSLTFMGLSGAVRMLPDIGPDNIHGNRLSSVREGLYAGITGVLGAGNVSSIPATDSLNRIMFEGRRVLLKLNPVNDYLLGSFEAAFAPLIQADLLRIIRGGGEIGHSLVHDQRISDVHITGSTATHDAIVWGSDPAEQTERRQNHNPLLQKPVTSELGNVTPWIIVPGTYSGRQLKSQAAHVAASITNNVSFNCLATKAILTWDRWEQRDEFLSLLRARLAETPQRPAYYPGATERFRRYSAQNIEPDDRNLLPWTVLDSQSIDERPELFQEESFVCVCAETPLSAKSPEDFLATATAFVNDRMHGTLCCSLTLPNSFQRQQTRAFHASLNQLRYGSICVNQWSGLAYGFTSPPWGAYPGATLEHVESGIGSVHNTYLLDGFEKTILAGPLINFPKPVWFPAHRKALEIAQGLLHLYDNPSAIRLPSLFWSALTG